MCSRYHICVVDMWQFERGLLCPFSAESYQEDNVGCIWRDMANGMRVHVYKRLEIKNGIFATAITKFSMCLILRWQKLIFIKSELNLT